MTSLPVLRKSVELDPQPFRPILRGMLVTGGRARFLRADISGAAGDDSPVSQRAVWWPPGKLAASPRPLPRKPGWRRRRRHAPPRVPDPGRDVVETLASAAARR